MQFEDPRLTKARKFKGRIADIDKDIDMLTAAKEEEWKAIKDFVVSYTRTDDGLKRIESIKGKIRKLENEKAKMKEKFANLRLPKELRELL